LLDVPSWTNSENAAVLLNIQSGRPSQVFFFKRIDAKRPNYIIIARHSHKVVALNRGQVVQQTYTGLASQQWRIVEQDPERYSLENVATGDVIRSSDKFTGNVAQVIGVARPSPIDKLTRQFFIEIPV